MKALELPCDTNPRDLLTLCRVGGCAAVTAKGQVNLTPAQAREAAAWLMAFADEVESSLARLRNPWLLRNAGPLHRGCSEKEKQDLLALTCGHRGDPIYREQDFIPNPGYTAAEATPCAYCHRHNCDCCTGDYRCCDPADRCRRHQ